MPTSKTAQVVAMARRTGVVRPRDLRHAGIPHHYLQRLCQRGELIRLGRGLYGLPDADLTENHSLVEVCKRVPHGVICLLTALRFHELTTQAPFQVWVAIDFKARLPKMDGLQLRVVRFSGKALSSGIEEHMIEGVKVRVYCPAKTVVDCFKYRNKIGLDVALEALRDCKQ